MAAAEQILVHKRGKGHGAGGGGAEVGSDGNPGKKHEGVGVSVGGYPLRARFDNFKVGGEGQGVYDIGEGVVARFAPCGKRGVNAQAEISTTFFESFSRTSKRRRRRAGRTGVTMLRRREAIVLPQRAKSQSSFLSVAQMQNERHMLKVFPLRTAPSQIIAS